MTQSKDFRLPRLGVNIDHIATLRQLRGTPYPKLSQALDLALAGGAEQITLHLREDRRHIQDQDLDLVKKHLAGRALLNLEMAVTQEMIGIAKKLKPDWVCLVPEKREELTTEGGLDITGQKSRVAEAIKELQGASIRVSLFIEPTLEVVNLSAELNAQAVELHTGAFCLSAQSSGLESKNTLSELKRIELAGYQCKKLGLRLHAGHGIDLENVRPLAALTNADHQPLIEEYNIGHYLVCRATLVGLERAVREMSSAILAP